MGTEEEQKNRQTEERQGLRGRADRQTDRGGGRQAGGQG